MEKVEYKKLIIKRKQESIIENCKWIVSQAESVRKEIDNHLKNKDYPFGDFGYVNEKLSKIEQTVKDIRTKYETKPEPKRYPKPTYDRCNAGHLLVEVYNEKTHAYDWDCPICIKKMEDARNEKKL